MAGRSSAATGVWLAATFWSSAALSVAQSLPSTIYPTLTPNSQTSSITAGPDGALWFIERIGVIGRISTEGVVSEYPAEAPLGEIVAGPDGAMWFTAGMWIGRITTGDRVTIFPVPPAAGIAFGPDGALWFTEFGSAKIGRLTTAGTVTEFPLRDPSSMPRQITAGPDGAMWFTEQGSGMIGRITTSGTIAEYRLPAAVPGEFGGITAGPDGAIWFTNFQTVNRITTSGAIMTFPLPAQFRASDIVVGPDGALWFVADLIVADLENGIGRITTNGVLSLYPKMRAARLASGPDGAIWYTEKDGSSIGRIQIAPTGPPVISAMNTLSAFGASPTAAPGSWIEIYGSNLAPAPFRTWTSEDFSGASAPTALEGVRVTVGGQPAFVEYISPSQVNVQVPSNIGIGTQQVIVTTAVAASAPKPIGINSIQPGLYVPAATKIGGTQYVGATFTDGSLVLPEGSLPCVATRRAQPGETITLYGVGFGPVSPPTPAGQITPVQSNQLTTPLTVSFGQTEALVTFAGLGPSTVGLYQFNTVVPNLNLTADPALSFSAGGMPGTQSAYVAVQQMGPVLQNLTVNFASVVHGTGTVTLSSPAPLGGAVVGLYTDTLIIGVPTCRVVVDAGSASKDFFFVLNIDPHSSFNIPVTITAMFNGSSIKTHSTAACSPGSTGQICP